MKLRVQYPGPGGPTGGLWVAYYEDVAVFLDGVCAERGSLSAVTYVGRAMRGREHFDRWLDRETAWMVSVGISEKGEPPGAAWMKYPGHRLIGLRSTTAQIHIDVGDVTLDDLDLSPYVDRANLS